MVAQFKNLDNAVETLKAMPEVDYYERIGSLVFYTINKFNIPTEKAKILFAGTVIEEFIERPSLGQMKNTFAAEVKAAHNGVYEEGLQSFSQIISKSYNQVDMFYLVFFTGNVKQKGDETQFHECAKFLINNEDESCTLLNCDDKWIVNTSDAIGKYWEQAKMWDKSNLGECLAASLKKHGYKFGSGKKDLHFVPSPLTDEFYKLKKIINGLSGSSLSIAPVICGCREDAEEYRKIVTDGFEGEMLEGKKSLFEICLNLYSQQKEWEDYQKLVEIRNIEALKLTHIARNTRYGQQLTNKLEIVNDNACDAEWKEITEEWVFNVKPCRRIRTERLLNIQETFKKALDKISTASKVRYFQTIREDIERDVLVTAKILAKVSEQAIDEVLQII